MRRRAAFVLGLSLACRLAAGADGPPVGEDVRVRQALRLLEAWADGQQAYERLPGVSMAVVHDQSVLWSRGFGLAHLDREVPATPETMYSICSISKLFTSVAVMQQRDAGRLRLDDPVAQHLPWMTIEQSFEGSAPITVRGILTHSSGLPREVDIPYWTGPEYPFPSREKALERVAQQKTLYPAERFFQHSNLGLTLAGELVAATSGEPFAQYVRKRVLDPLDLRDTRTDHSDDLRGGRLATGYTAPRRDGSRRPVPPYEVRGIAPAAGFTSTVLDLGRLGSWQFRVLGAAGGGGHRGARGEHAPGDAAGAVDGPRLEGQPGPGLRDLAQQRQDVRGARGLLPGLPERAPAADGREGGDGLHDEHERRGHASLGAARLRGGGAGDREGARRSEGREARGPRPRALRGPIRGLHGGRADRPAVGGRARRALAAHRQPDGRRPIKLKPSGEHRFRRARPDGSLGEEVVFEMGPDGVPTRMLQHSNYATRVR